MQVGIWFRFTLSVTSRHGSDLLPWLKGGQLWNKSTKTWYYMWKYRQWHTIVCSWILAPGWCIFFHFFLDLKGLYWNAFFQVKVSLLFPSPCKASQHFHCENNSINGNLGNLIKEKRKDFGIFNLLSEKTTSSLWETNKKCKMDRNFFYLQCMLMYTY